jgi:hypothetical protein
VGSGKLKEDSMAFQWNPHVPEEHPSVEGPPWWLYLVLYLVIEAIAVAVTVANWPKGVAVAPEKLLYSAGAIPFLVWVMLACLIFIVADDEPSYQAATYNRGRWKQIARWQRQSRAGIAVLDSVILAPEPDLAVRMLGLEGTPPDNAGRVMALEGIEGAEGVSRVHGLLTQLMKPLLPRLKLAIRSESFEIVMQCERPELSDEVKEVWKQLELPGVPHIRWLDNSRDVGFADHWFEDYVERRYSYAVDQTPKYRLLLAWHLHAEAENTEPAFSESAVALLVGSPAFMAESDGKVRQQAWLLRQITGDADLVDKSLARLLDAGQVPRERIRHLWYSRLTGLAQHATLGAVRESGLKPGEHALEQAIGPQAPVARWVLQALAVQMAHFGQGPQLIALPAAQGVALNVVAKEPAAVDVPWKEEYDYRRYWPAELAFYLYVWGLAAMLTFARDEGTHDSSWLGLDCLVTVVFFVVRHRVLQFVADLIDQYW